MVIHVNLMRGVLAAMTIAMLVSCSAQQTTRQPTQQLAQENSQPAGGAGEEQDEAAKPTFEERDAAVQSFATMTLADARRVQTEVMDFADDLTLRLVEAVDELEQAPQSLEARVVAHRLKYTVAHGATLIAAARNPQIALLDMMVMIHIQRKLLETNVIPKYFGPEADRLRLLFDDAERQIRTLASRALSEEQVGIVDRLADKWIEEHPDRKYGAYARLSEFSSARQMATGQASNGRSSNVLGFLFIDPLAGLDPTTREIEQARMFAERGLFYMQRMPTLISWQTELLLLDSVSEPESRQVLANMQSLSDSIERISKEVEQLQDELPGMIGTERQSILEHLETTIDEQRQLAIDQALEGISAERRALIDQLAQQEEELRPMITDLRQTVDSATALSESVRSTTEQFEELAKLLHLDEPKDPDAAQTDITDFTEAMRETTRTASELVKLSESIKGTTAPEVLEERLVMIEQRLMNAEQSANRILDRAFRLVLTLVAVLVVGLALVVVLSAWLRGRAPKTAA